MHSAWVFLANNSWTVSSFRRHSNSQILLAISYAIKVGLAMDYGTPTNPKFY